MKIIAVASGKGGVGKSTVAANLALAIAATGVQVGLLDADIYGPSQPALLGMGVGVRPQLVQDPVSERFLPITRHGLQTMSIGYLVESDEATIWRGPIISKVLLQLFTQTAWSVDYLIVDLPPGTGDIPLTLAQKIPVTAVLMVTTPQQLSLLDVAKAMAMFRKLNIPILGIVENMVHFTCPHCTAQTAIFNHGGGSKLAQDFAVPLLAQLALQTELQDLAAHGGLHLPDPWPALAHTVMVKAADIAVKINDLSAKKNRLPKIEAVRNKATTH